MSDEPSIAVQALSPRGKARAKEVWDFQRAQARLSRVVHSGMRKVAIVVSLIALAEAAALFKLVPLVRVVPVFVPVQADGSLAHVISTDPAVTIEGLKSSQAALSALLWQYVRMRESYSWAEANYVWDVVSAMSAVDVREQFQKWYVYTNKTSPQMMYGFKTAVKVSWVEARLDDDKYSVTFWRQQFDSGNPVSRPQLWTCNLVFSTDYNLPLVQRLTYNPAAVVVTSYPGCFSKGPAPGGLPGGDAQ